jgi:hypothetical protein
MAKHLRALLAGVALAGLVPVAAQASEMTYFKTVTDTDVATFGMGYLRGVGTGSLTVSGLSGTISSAWLFWHGPTNSTDPLANAVVSFGGTTVTGVNIGFSDDNFWSSENSQAYRADVSSLVTGDGAYAIADFLGTDAEINGLSLIVFFDDGVAANNRDVVLFNGNDANFANSYDALNWNATLDGVDYSGGAAELVLHVSDGQDFGSSDDGSLMFNAVSLGSGGLFQGDGVQFGDGSFPSNGALWDIESFDIASTLMVDNTLSMSAVSDALSLIVAQFNLPVGAAPPPPPPPGVPEPASWAMMIAGLGLVGGALRRTRRTTVNFA